MKKWEDQLHLYINDIQPPEQLSPDNIANMLKARQAAKGGHKNIASRQSGNAADYSAARRSTITANFSKKSKKQAIMYRSTAVVAACAALTFGLTVLLRQGAMPTDFPAGYSDTSDGVTEAQNYADVYKVVQDAFVNNGTDLNSVPDGSNLMHPSEQDSSSAVSSVTAPEQPGTEEQPPQKDFTAVYDVISESAPGVNKADILRSDGKNLYYISGGALHVVSAGENAPGDMEYLSKVVRPNSTPVEMYLENNRLAVIYNTAVLVPYDNGSSGAVDSSGESGSADENRSSESTSESSSQDSQHNGDTGVLPSTGESQEEVPPPESSRGSSSAQGNQTEKSSPDADEPSGGAVESSDGENGDLSVSSISDSSDAGEALDHEDASDDNKTTAENESSAANVIQNNVVVEIYDATDPAALTLVNVYQQNGAYLSSQMVDGSLYLVTSYARYQTKPLETESDLDTYVPAYYINDVKRYVEAKDICLPAKASSTSYTILSGLSLQNSEQPLTSIKAFLGQSTVVSASASALYMAGSGSVRNHETTSLNKFNISNGVVSYAANAVLDGSISVSGAVSEHEGKVRVVTFNSQSSQASVYVLDQNLTVLGSWSDSAGSQKIDAVRFNSDVVYLQSADGKTTAVSLTDPTAMAPIEKVSAANSGNLYQFSDTRLLGVGEEYDESGKQVGLRLCMFDRNNLNELWCISVAGKFPASFSSEVVRRNGIFMDAAQSVIGVPTVSSGDFGNKNSYYVFSYGDDAGFTQRSVLEYNDVDASAEFNRGLIIGDVFYAVSGNRIVSARLSDLKVIEALSLK